MYVLATTMEMPGNNLTSSSSPGLTVFENRQDTDFSPEGFPRQKHEIIFRAAIPLQGGVVGAGRGGGCVSRERGA